jgi:hypothetical protein
MKVWVLEANFMNRDRKGVRVFYKKEDVIDALLSLSLKRVTHLFGLLNVIYWEMN